MPSDWFSDTDPRAMAVFLECQRRLSPGQRLDAVFRLNEFLHGLAEANVRKLYPEAGEPEVFLRALAPLEPRVDAPRLRLAADGDRGMSAATFRAVLGALDRLGIEYLVVDQVERAVRSQGVHVPQFDGGRTAIP